MREFDMWDLSDALRLVSLLNGPLAAAGFGVGMAGSVLTAGGSDHDLDLIVFPLRTSENNTNDARSLLWNMGMNLLFNRGVVTARWRKLGSDDEKHVEVWEHEGKRVDIFFLK